jgi:hypothetical protein
MARCLFCRVEKSTITEEHIFPAALGGTLVVKDCVCDTCNHGFSKFEQPLAVELTPLRNLLQIPNRTGKVPATSAKAKTATEEFDAKVRGDGTVQLKPLIRKIETAEGKKEIEYRFLTPRAKEKLAKEAKEKGWQLIETGPGEPVQAEIHVGGDLEEIGSSNGLRTAAKIAYVGMTCKTGLQFASSDVFIDVRKYIMDGTGEEISRLFVNIGYMDAVQQGPHQHSLTLAARKDKGRIDAIVRLFGWLCYFVVLSKTYSGPDFCETIVFDAYRGERNGILLARADAEILQTEDVLTNASTVWDNLFESGSVYCEYLEEAIHAKYTKTKPC